MEYAAPDGTVASHAVALYGSDEGAAKLAAAVASAAAEKGFTQTESGDVRLQSGEVVGKVYVLEAANGVQAVTWSNKKLFALAISAKPRAVEFYNALPY